MGKAQRTILAILAALTLAALAAVIFTWQWADYRARLRAMRANLRQQESLVDTRALDTAEQLSQLAESRREKAYAQEALGWRITPLTQHSHRRFKTPRKIRLH